MQNAPFGGILQYFRPSLSYHLSFCLFSNGRLRQVLLYLVPGGMIAAGAIAVTKENNKEMERERKEMNEERMNLDEERNKYKEEMENFGDERKKWLDEINRLQSQLGEKEMVKHMSSQIRKCFERKFVNISLPISFHICFGCLKESSHRDGSF